MNLNKLFEPQSELDRHIVEKHNLQGQDLLKKKTVALLTELFECVNEARFFKFWSKDPKPNTEAERYVMSEVIGEPITQKFNPLLEEYVDVIHFALSIANDLGYHEHTYKDGVNYDLSNLVIGTANLITLLPEVNHKRHIELTFNFIIKLGYQLGFTEEQVIEAYFAKNEINHNRQESGY